MELGQLSARYESARKGVEAIGYDSGGGWSFGTYQLATVPGTLDRFIEWCRVEFPEVRDGLLPARTRWQSNRSDAGTIDAFKSAWLFLALGPARARLMAAEHGFIKATHYDAALAHLVEPVRAAVDGCEALQQVLWSCAVQHGAGGAAQIFNQAAGEAGLDPRKLIGEIYDRRGRRLSRLTAAEQNAVRSRYRSEMTEALKLLEVAG